MKKLALLAFLPLLAACGSGDKKESSSAASATAPVAEDCSKLSGTYEMDRGGLIYDLKIEWSQSANSVKQRISMKLTGDLFKAMKESGGRKNSIHCNGGALTMIASAESNIVFRQTGEEQVEVTIEKTDGTVTNVGIYTKKQ